jgi:ribosomal protein S18 acetylase RimI-like enzyme
VPHILVEPITSEDDDAVTALLRLLPQVSSRAGQVRAERVRQVLAEPGTTVVVARIDDRVVGSATLVRLVTLVGQFGYVEEVVVDESARGAGIGRALMDGLIRLARSGGLDFLELTSRPAREAANGLYQAMGFTPRETNVYRLDLRT